jgi:hypothetical protein
MDVYFENVPKSDLLSIFYELILSLIKSWSEVQKGGHSELIHLLGSSLHGRVRPDPAFFFPERASGCLLISFL